MLCLRLLLRSKSSGVRFQVRQMRLNSQVDSSDGVILASRNLLGKFSVSYSSQHYSNRHDEREGMHNDSGFDKNG
jgi:hypothetical protein